MTVKSSQAPWFEPTIPLGDAAEDAGPFGGVCGPVGVDAKKVTHEFLNFPDLHFLFRDP